MQICRAIGIDAEKFGQQTVCCIYLRCILGFKKNFLLLDRNLLINSDELSGKL